MISSVLAYTQQTGEMDRSHRTGEGKAFDSYLMEINSFVTVQDESLSLARKGSSTLGTAQDSGGRSKRMRTVHCPTQSAGFCWIPTDLSPGLFQCDKGQIDMSSPGGVQWSPLEYAIFRWTARFGPDKSAGLRRIPPDRLRQQSPTESDGIHWTAPAYVLHPYLIINKKII